jgi:hypothetical protein
MAFSLGADPSALRSVDKTLIPMAAPDDTTFRSIVERWAQVRADFPEGQAMAIGPEGVPGFATPTRLSLTPLAFATLPFQYWSGNIEVCLEFISSPLIRARVGIVIVPPTVSDPVTFPVEGELMTFVVDLVGSTCFNFEVPYMYPSPTRAVGTLYSTTVPAAGTGYARIKYFYLQEPIGPSETTVYPEANVYVRGAPSFTVGVPTLDNINDLVIAQSGLGPLSEAVFGEAIDDLILLTRRSTLHDIYKFVLPGGTVTGMALPVKPFSKRFLDYGTLTNFAAGWSFDSWLATAYLGEMGGRVVTISPDVETFPLFGRLTNVLSSAGEINLPVTGTSPPLANGGRGAVYLDARNQTGWEVRVPDRTGRPFRAAWCVNSGSSDKLFEVVAATSFGVGTSLNNEAYCYWVSGADDFVLGGFLCAPTVALG